MIRRTTQWLLGAVLVWTVCTTLSERNALATLKTVNSPFGTTDSVEVFLGACTSAPCQIVVYKRLSDNACQFTVVGNGTGLTQDLVVYGSTVADVMVIAANFIDTGCGYSVGNFLSNGWSTTLHGGSGDDALYNYMPINPLMWGDAGNDFFMDHEGGIMNGGAGNDVFWSDGPFTNESYVGGDGNDCIEDFNGAAASVDCGAGTDTLVPSSSGAVPASVNCERIGNC